MKRRNTIILQSSNNGYFIAHKIRPELFYKMYSPNISPVLPPATLKMHVINRALRYNLLYLNPKKANFIFLISITAE